MTEPVTLSWELLDGDIEGFPPRLLAETLRYGAGEPPDGYEVRRIEEGEGVSYQVARLVYNWDQYSGWDESRQVCEHRYRFINEAMVSAQSHYNGRGWTDPANTSFET